MLLFFYSWGALGYWAIPQQSPSSQICYSPVEMAALFSKPRRKNSGTSKSALKKKLRSLNKRIKKLEEKRGEIVGRLADSLNAKKAKVRKTRLAGKIEQYMYNKYNSWECGKGSSSGSSRSRGGGSAHLFQPLEFDVFAVFSGEGFSLSKEGEVEGFEKRSPAGREEKKAVKPKGFPFLKGAAGFLKGLFSFKENPKDNTSLKSAFSISDEVQSAQPQQWLPILSFTTFGFFDDMVFFLISPSVANAFAISVQDCIRKGGQPPSTVSRDDTTKMITKNQCKGLKKKSQSPIGSGIGVDREKENCEKDTAKIWVGGEFLLLGYTFSANPYFGSVFLTILLLGYTFSANPYFGSVFLTILLLGYTFSANPYFGSVFLTILLLGYTFSANPYFGSVFLTILLLGYTFSANPYFGSVFLTILLLGYTYTAKVWVGGECVTKKKNCEKDTAKVWVGGECVTKKKNCEKDTAKVWVGGECVTKKKNCEKDTAKVWVGGECVTKKKNCEKDTAKVWVGGECVTKKKNCEKDTAKVWVGGECVTKKKNCEKDTAKVWVGGECVTKKKNCEKDTAKVWVGGECVTKKKNCEKDTAKVWVGGECVIRKQYECEKAGSTYIGSQCLCKIGKPVTDKCKCTDKREPWPATGANQICKTKCTGDSSRNPQGVCVNCPEGEHNARWQNDEAFEAQGNVHRGLCDPDRYGKSSRDCRDALEDLKNILSNIEKLKKRRTELDEKIFNMENSEETEEDETGLEASGLCIECVQELRALSRPSGGQIFGNVLSMGLGTALSVFGVREARRSADSANEMLALQGLPAQNNFGYSMAGLSAGFPFIQSGLHGLTQGNASQGGYGCSPTVSPYAPHPSMGQSFNPYGMY